MTWKIDRAVDIQRSWAELALCQNSRPTFGEVHECSRSHSAATRYLSTFYMLSTRHYTIAMTSSVHHHDIVRTSPLRPRHIPILVCCTAEGHRPSPILKNTSLTVVHVAQIIPQIFPCPSPNIWRHFGDTSPNIPLRIINTLRVCFLVGSHVQYRHRSSPERVFFIASTSPDILALVGP